MFRLFSVPRKSATHFMRTLSSLYVPLLFSMFRTIHRFPSLPVSFYNDPIRCIHQHSRKPLSSGNERYSVALLPSTSIHKFQNTVTSLIQDPSPIPAAVVVVA